MTLKGILNKLWCYLPIVYYIYDREDSLRQVQGKTCHHVFESY